MLEMADYNFTEDTACQHSGMNKWDDEHPAKATRKSPLSEKMTGGHGKQAMWRSEQKNMSWTKNLAGKVKSGDDLVMDSRSGICSTATARMLLEQHRTLFGCDLHSDILCSAEPEPFLTFSSRVTNLNSDIGTAETVEAAAGTFNEEVEGV